MNRPARTTLRSGFLALLAMILVIGFQVGLVHHASGHHSCPDEGKAPQNHCSLCQVASQYALLGSPAPIVPVPQQVQKLEFQAPAQLLAADLETRRARSPPGEDFS